MRAARDRIRVGGLWLRVNTIWSGHVATETGDLEPGQTQTLNCIPDGKYGKYTKITAEATF